MIKRFVLWGFFLCITGAVTVTAAPVTDPEALAESLREAISFGVSDSGLITGPGHVEIDAAQFAGQPEHPDQESMLQDAKNLSGDSDGLQEFEREWSQKLSGTAQYNTAQSLAFDLTLGSFMSSGGSYEIEAYGCTIRRANSAGMLYHPNNPVGSRISGDGITIDEDTCQPTFVSRFGATCELLSTDTECVEADNTRIIKSQQQIMQFNIRRHPGTIRNSSAWPRAREGIEVFYYWTDQGRTLLDPDGYNPRGNNTYRVCSFSCSDISTHAHHVFTASRYGNRRIAAGIILVDLSEFHPDAEVRIRVRAQGAVWNGNQQITINNARQNAASSGYGQYGFYLPNANSFDYLWNMGAHNNFSGTWRLRPTHGPDTYAIVVEGMHRSGQWHGYPHANPRGGLHDLLGVQWVEVSALSIPDTDVSGIDPSTLPACYSAGLNDGDLCSEYQAITLTPDVAQQELAPLWHGDDQANVCWKAGSKASCTLETKEPDPLALAIAAGAYNHTLVDAALLDAMGDCTTNTVSETITNDLNFYRRKSCERPINPTISGCSLSRVVELDDNLNIIEDRWNGSSRCELIESRLASHGQNCNYNLTYDNPDCIMTANGTLLCSCNYIESQGGDTSICPAGTQRITPDMAAAVSFLNAGNAHMCVGYQNSGAGSCPDGTSAYGGICIQNDIQFPAMTCKGHNTLGNGISQGNKRSTSLTISDLICPPPNDVGCDTYTDPVTGASITQCGDMDIENTCGNLSTNPQCSLVTTRCLDNIGHGLVCQSEGDCFDQLCFSEERVYDCQITESYQDTVERTEMVCGESKFACIDGSCFGREDEINEDFGKAVALLTAAESIGTHMKCDAGSNGQPDMNTCRIFGGEYARCRRGAGPLTHIFNCCDISSGSGTLNREDYAAAVVGAAAAYVAWDVSSGVAAVAAATTSIVASARALISFLVPCYPEEYDVAMGKETDSLIYLGQTCGKRISVGFSSICTRRDRHYCTFDSPLGRILMEQAALQLTDDDGNLWRDYTNPQREQSFCEGMTLNQIASLDWSQINLDEWEHILRSTNNLPPQKCGAMDLGGSGCTDVHERNFDYDFDAMTPTGGPFGIQP